MFENTAKNEIILEKFGVAHSNCMNNMIPYSLLLGIICHMANNNHAIFKNKNNIIL